MSVTADSSENTQAISVRMMDRNWVGRPGGRAHDDRRNRDDHVPLLPLRRCSLRCSSHFEHACVTDPLRPAIGAKNAKLALNTMRSMRDCRAAVIRDPHLCYYFPDQAKRISKLGVDWRARRTHRRTSTLRRS